jgi:hypothetical protein
MYQRSTVQARPGAHTRLAQSVERQPFMLSRYNASWWSGVRVPYRVFLDMYFPILIYFTCIIYIFDVYDIQGSDCERALWNLYQRWIDILCIEFDFYFVVNGLGAEGNESPTSFTAINRTLYVVFVVKPVITIGPAKLVTSVYVAPLSIEYL